LASELGIVLEIITNKVPSFPVSEKKTKALQARMVAVGCDEKQLREQLNRGSAVVLEHLPTGIRIRCNREKSQALNRFFARRFLVEELEARAQNSTRREVKKERLRAKKYRNGPQAGPSALPSRNGISKGVAELLRQWETAIRSIEAPPGG
jgi:peptide chain release factor